MKGTSTEQDARFSNKDKKLIKEMKYDQILDQEVDMDKVMLDTLKTWIAARISEILGFEDEVVIDYVYEILESERPLNPRKMQIQITGFLDAKNARAFMRELWHLLLSAQANGGIPKEIVELRMLELARENKNKEQLETVIDSNCAEVVNINSKKFQRQLSNSPTYKRDGDKKSVTEPGDMKSNYRERCDDSDDDRRKPNRSNYKSKQPNRNSKYFTSSESPPPDEKPTRRSSHYSKYPNSRSKRTEDWKRDRYNDAPTVSPYRYDRKRTRHDKDRDYDERDTRKRYKHDDKYDDRRIRITSYRTQKAPTTKRSPSYSSSSASSKPQKESEYRKRRRSSTSSRRSSDDSRISRHRKSFHHSKSRHDDRKQNYNSRHRRDNSRDADFDHHSKSKRSYRSRSNSPHKPRNYRSEDNRQMKHVEKRSTTSISTDSNDSYDKLRELALKSKRAN